MKKSIHAAKYKGVAKKIRPVNQPMPQDLNPPLERPKLSRDPYKTPLTPFPPEFKETERITHERLKSVNFGPPGGLTKDEIKLLLYVIVLREKAIAFTEEERGILKHSYGKPYKIPVIEHTPWQQKPIPVPSAIRADFIELVRKRIKTGLYEQSTSSYSSPVFCVAKSNGKLRIVHDLQQLNKVTIKDAGLPPKIEEFVESFAGRACYGLGDIMGGYDKRELDQASRPLTTFDTPLGRLQLTRLPQGATNSVAVYQAQMMWILQEELPENVGIFIDDGGIKGPRSDYGGARLKENKNIQRFIWEYAVTLERILFRIEEAGLTISGEKFACCVPALDIVGDVVSQKGRTIAVKKLNKVQSWPTLTTKKEVRQFLGLCVYVRMFIKDFSTVAAPLRWLTRNDSEFIWTEKCEEAFKSLKQIVGEDIVLKGLEYGEDAGKIILAVDSSSIAAGAVLMQEDKDGIARPVLYESVCFSDRESDYSQSKLELCGVTKILKKLQTMLWGQHFELQVDAKALIQMINSPSLPTAPMTRWVAFIQLFSFDLVHKPGKTFTMPDSLSRRPPDKDEIGKAFDDENWIKPHPGLGTKEVIIVETETMGAGIDQVGFWKRMKEYLGTLVRPPECSDKEFQKLKRRSSNYFVEEGQLKKRHDPHSQIIVSIPKMQEIIMKALHENLGHRGISETYRRIKLRYWWEGMKKSIRRWVKSCESCQKRSRDLQKEEGKATYKTTLFERVSMDAVHIKAGKWKYLVVARDDFSGWAETIALVNLTSKNVAEWFVAEWIYRYGVPKEVTVDGGPEFKKELQSAMRKVGTNLRMVTPYYPEAQGMVERGHKEIKDALTKISNFNKTTTGYSPYELQFGQLATLPIDHELGSFLMVNWTNIRTTAELLEARAAQLSVKEEMMEEAYQKMKTAREKSVRYWDRRLAHRLRRPLEPGDLVLVYNKALETQWGNLFKHKWNGPYRIVKQIHNGPYVLAELDGTILNRNFAANHIKKFYPRGEEKEEEGEDISGEEEEEEEDREESFEESPTTREPLAPPPPPSYPPPVVNNNRYEAAPANILRPVPRYPVNAPDVQMRSPPQQQAAQAMPPRSLPQAASQRQDLTRPARFNPYRYDRRDPQQLESRVPRAPRAPRQQNTAPPHGRDLNGSQNRRNTVDPTKEVMRMGTFFMDATQAVANIRRAQHRQERRNNQRNNQGNNQGNNQRNRNN
ncbi:hypothetical protein MJO28_007935 [Puccinia striiformis f. sp. tritici]|uniref:Uncharacterized protein n=1 Tax=Puccinia striiformis f. sp. tritici TaxID=168172 RepID=A0ACC0E9R0_9BASI|nr:hypothetical protein MJO28_007935 [Puccinia striiformis f. sp. tritici]